ncbi:hypothetical protein B0F90DRAFT_1291941 [Multifurca ochricompacta]|uniref:Uncharacterized protein n=1 Tax=Multifurca ochricompacta TaxID=376703 RepID=A0AAD4LXD2_9AGAM|nr:hypothetical protein B0F90DRAFT_1291941 [Multifurca ochricompacta]
MSTTPSQSASNQHASNPDMSFAFVAEKFQEGVEHYVLGKFLPTIPAPLRWFWTILVFFFKVKWFIFVSRLSFLSRESPRSTFTVFLQTLPIRIALDIYERQLVVMFPILPSIRTRLLGIRTTLIASLPKSTPPTVKHAVASFIGSDPDEEDKDS